MHAAEKRKKEEKMFQFGILCRDEETIRTKSNFGKGGTAISCIRTKNMAVGWSKDCCKVELPHGGNNYLWTSDVPIRSRRTAMKFVRHLL